MQPDQSVLVNPANLTSLSNINFSTGTPIRGTDHGGAVFCSHENSNPTLICCDIYGNEGGDWVDCIADQAGINGNFSADPLFCDMPSGDLQIGSISPCVPANNDCGVLIGAAGMGCTDWAIVSEAIVKSQLVVVHPSDFQRKAPDAWSPEVVPYWFTIYLTFSEPIGVSVGDSARVYVDVDGSSTFGSDEQYPASVSSTDSESAWDASIDVVVDDGLQVNDARVAIHSVAGINLVNEARRRIDYLRLNAPFTDAVNQQPLAAEGRAPDVYCLGANYPNPFNAKTLISYSLGEAGPVRLTIYDILGRRVRMLVDEVKAAGKHETTWDGLDRHGNPVASGIYFYRLAAEGFVDTKKMILMK